MSYRFVQRRRIWYVVSGILLLASVAFIAIGGLRLGTDFTGGSLVQLTFPEGQRPTNADVIAGVEEIGFGSATVQAVEETDVIIRLRELTTDEHGDFLTKMTEQFPGADEQAFSVVGPTIGRELQQRALIAIALVLLGIILYVSWAFRKSSGAVRGWAFGLNAILALIHDILIVIGVFAFLGYAYGVEVDALFVTALLTILGFSVHDTIVVFDRIRERMRTSSAPLPDILNESVNSTLVRSINTTLTTLLVLVALFLFGGTSIHYFVLALIVGMVIGTYSSIFIASPMLLIWARRRS